MRPPPERGASRLPNTGSASAYPCAEDIIARFVEFGKMGEKPRRGAESFRPPALSVSCADSSPTGGGQAGAEWTPPAPCLPPWGRCPRRGRRGFPRQKRNPPAGGLGIDFFPYHVILKIKRGAAGRREPPHKLLSSNRRADQANGGYFFFIWRTREMMATIRIPKSKRSEYVTMTSPPLRCSGGGKKFRPPPERGASRLPNTGSASAYPCAEDIIARFVEFGKMGEKPRRGESSSHRLRRCQLALSLLSLRDISP